MLPMSECRFKKYNELKERLSRVSKLCCSLWDETKEVNFGFSSFQVLGVDMKQIQMSRVFYSTPLALCTQWVLLSD